MAKKPTTPTTRPATSAKPAVVPARAATPAPASTPVRNTAIPKAQPTTSRIVTHEMIAKRAYEISQSPQCGSETDNWLRAERELKGL